MRPRWLAVVSALLTFHCPSAGFARDHQNEAPFDRPVQTRRVMLGPSQSMPREKKEIRCFTFAHLMVKEIDAREIGDEQISILPLESATKRPPCQIRNAANERVIPSESWSGYFLGVKGDYVFLSAEDGVNGGLGISVYHGADPTSVFQDSVKFAGNRNHFQSVTVDGGGLRLRYTRVYSAKCSVQIDGTACWTQIAAATHLPAAPAPDCAAGYLHAKQAMAAARCEIQSRKSNAACLKTEMDRQAADDASPSVIDYVVDVSLQPLAQTVTPVGNAISCRPAD
jgi:hypothetical protein